MTVIIEKEERTELERLLRAGTTEQRLVKGINIVLAAAEGLGNANVAKRCKCNIHTARMWRNRWIEGGLLALHDAPGRGKKPVYTGEAEARIIAATLEPPDNWTHWSARRLARKVGLSKSTVHRIWQSYDLQPHRQETFTYYNDPLLVEKVVDIVGLYLGPPGKALVLSIDEKSQMKALNHTQPLLPLKFGHPECRTHDDKHDGTTTLFAAFDVKTGQVFAKCKDRHRHQDFLDFMRLVDKQYPEGELHLIRDNYGTHTHPKVKKWFAGRPGYKLHFTPTPASWLNQVETWFSILIRQAVRRGSFNGVTPLRKAVHAFITGWNGDAHLFKWVKTSEVILEKAVR